MALSITMAQTAMGAETGAFMTGKTLALLCSSSDADDQLSCQSYIAGVVDYHRLLRGLGTAPTVDFCLPDKLPMADMKKIVRNYLVGRTEHNDFVAAPAVAMALYGTYPCKKR